MAPPQGGYAARRLNDLDQPFSTTAPDSLERSLSWQMRARRNSRDYERLAEHSEAHITAANVTLMTRRIVRLRNRQAESPRLLTA